MDAYLYADLVPEGTIPEDGPNNRRRTVVYVQSLWFNANHEQFPPCRFEDYLSLRGWNRELLQRGQWRAAHPDSTNKSDDDCIFDAVGVIQAWMTLGFLEDLYQNRTWLASYLHPVGEQVVTSMKGVLDNEDLWPRLRRNPTGNIHIFNTKNFASNLTALTLTNKTKIYHGGLNAEHFARLPHLIEQYIRAFNHLNGLNDYDEVKNQTRNPIVPDSGFKICFFFTLAFPKLIFEAVRFHLHDYTPDLDLDAMKMEEPMFRSLRLQNGWCPYIVEKLYHTTNYTVLHWLWASDFNSFDGRDHSISNCTTSKCNALHVSSEEEYFEAHTKDCDSRCARFYPPADQVLEILSSNCVPLIVAKPSVSDPSSYSFNVDLFQPDSIESAMPYVAFSHVWSDGLGSTTERGIPSCQVNYLAQVASCQHSFADKSTIFWIDSLCVPAAPAARRKAIQFMSSTYKRAHTVLVLDSTLRKVILLDNAGRQSSPEYLLLRIFTSPWSQRVWTYQEGVLARRLVFLVAGGHSFVLDFPLDLDGGPGRGPLSIQLGRDMLHHIYSYLRSQVQALNGQVRAINMGTVALELRWRDTLHRDPNGRNDEVLAIGAVLGLNMRRLLNEREGPARMVLFYKLVGRLYRNIVFADIQRLQVDGFRWAPSTFLVKDERRPHTDLEKFGVDCTEHGLVGTFITFAVADGEEVLYDDSKRLTLVDERTSFDMTTGSSSQRVFSFTHIIIYPEAAPKSTKGTIFVAATVREDTDYARRHRVTERIDIVGTFQSLVYLSWFRDWDTPINMVRFPSGEQLVLVVMQRLKVLLR